MTVWEENFLDDQVVLRKDRQQLGYVEPAGGSWKVVLGNELIAVRPDKISAQSALMLAAFPREQGESKPR